VGCSQPQNGAYKKGIGKIIERGFEKYDTDLSGLARRRLLENLSVMKVLENSCQE